MKSEQTRQIEDLTYRVSALEWALTIHARTIERLMNVDRRGRDIGRCNLIQQRHESRDPRLGCVQWMP